MIGMGHELYHSGVRAGSNHGSHHGSHRLDMEALAEAAGEEWLTPIVKTVASKGEGIRELAAAVEKHRLFLFGSARGEARRRERLQAELYGLLRSTLTESAVEVLRAPLQIAVDKIFARESDPYSLIDDLVQKFRSSLSPAV